jgi:hypothetical protein
MPLRHFFSAEVETLLPLPRLLRRTTGCALGWTARGYALADRPAEPTPYMFFFGGGLGQP